MELPIPPILDPYVTQLAELRKENEQLKQELEKVRGQVQWYTNKVAEGHFGGPGLKGYQELGDRCAKLHNALDDERLKHAQTAKQLVDAQAIEGCTQKKLENIKAELKTALAIIDAMHDK